MKVIFAPEALEHLAATAEYISKHDPVAAAGLIGRVFDMIDQLAAGELDGPEQVLRSGERVRSWPVPPLRITTASRTVSPSSALVIRPADP